jgi:hypothetical protein
VKLIAGNKCEICGQDSKTVRLNSHHIIGRKFLGFRHDVRNGVCLCASHHKFSPVQSAHENPLWFYKWLSINRKKDLDYLEKNYSTAVKLEYTDTIDRLTKLMKKFDT